MNPLAMKTAASVFARVERSEGLRGRKQTLKVGRASDSIRVMLESPQGRALVEKSVDATGEYLAGRLFPFKARKA